MKWLKNIWKEAVVIPLQSVVSQSFPKNPATIRVYVFVSRPIVSMAQERKNGFGAPTTVYYASQKRWIYEFAIDNHLKGHIKEDIITIDEQKLMVEQGYWIR
jgi:hypothetical protein